MQITAANLNALRVTFSRVFQQAYDVAENWYTDVASSMPSSGRLNTYGWMQALPHMREWLGERVVNNLSEVNYILFNKPFELTYGIKRADLEDDTQTLGIYQSSFQELGKNAKKHPDKLLADALASGQNTACFDGQPYFSTSHPVNALDSAFGTYSNYSASGMALTAANYTTVRATMMAYKNAGGVRMGIRSNILLVPPSLETAARTIVEAELIPNSAGTAAQSNVLKGTSKVIVAEELEDAPTAWYLLCTTRGVRPFIYQLRRPAEFTMLVNLTDPSVFQRDQYEFGANIRDNVGFSLPFLAYKAVA